MHSASRHAHISAIPIATYASCDIITNYELDLLSKGAHSPIFTTLIKCKGCYKLTIFGRLHEVTIV